MSPCAYIYTVCISGHVSPLSGVPSVPPMDMAQQAQQLFSNPVVTNAAMQYGQGIMSAGQRYIDEQVREIIFEE